MVINATNFTSVGTWTEFTGLANGLTDGWLGLTFLFIIFVVSFGASKGYQSKHAFTASLLITTLSSLFLWVLNIVPYYVVISLVILLCIIAAAIAYNER